jgi:hypothetical protein
MTQKCFHTNDTVYTYIDGIPRDDTRGVGVSGAERGELEECNWWKRQTILLLHKKTENITPHLKRAVNKGTVRILSGCVVAIHYLP